MDRWVGKIAVITGASSGMGLAVSKLLLENEMTVVGLDIQSELMEERLSNIDHPGKFYAKKCDVSKEEQVKMIFAWIRDTLKNVHVLINCAGLYKRQSLIDMPTEDMELVINVNIMGYLYCIREAGKLIKEGKEEAMIVNFCSVQGHHVTAGDFNVYPVTKHAVKAISEICRREFIQYKNVRVANVSPSTTCTNFFNNDKETLVRIEGRPILRPEDVAHSILHIISAPVHVNITELIIMATGSAQ